MIKCQDSLAYLKEIKDFENDLIYCDPPYALGSSVGIRKDGKVDYVKAADFMSKREMPTGEYWEKWFIEAYRTLKHGGYLIMFGMDRQLLLFKYYACLSGFVEQQSLYWYFISNFPKATDLSKMIDKNLGLERVVIDEGKCGNTAMMGRLTNQETNNGTFDITKPNSDLAKKYEGYKYSISPLKQTNETIMVFQKPCKTGSPLHDTLAYENGDKTITVSALNIDGNRVGVSGKDTRSAGQRTKTFGGEEAISGGEGSPDYIPDENGRYPAQTFIDSKVAERLDLQSGISGGNNGTPYCYAGKEYDNKDTSMFNGDKPQAPSNFNDIGGCSKILHR